MLRWGPGPKQLGCVYHKQGIRVMKGEDLLVDVFVMPRIVRTRPVAITLGRYRRNQPVAKQKWQLSDPDLAVGSAAQLSKLFQALGIEASTSAKLGAEVEAFLRLESEVLKDVLAGLSSSQPDDRFQPTVPDTPKAPRLRQ